MNRPSHETRGRSKVRVIASAIETGHAASHRAFVPSMEQLDDVLEIVEHSLKDHYILRASAERLRVGVPVREDRGT